MRKKFLVIALSLIIIPLVISSFSDLVLSQTSTELKLVLGENRIIPISNPTRVVVGNPAVADVAGITKNEMTVVAKGVGRTTLVFWDNFGEQSYDVKVFAEDINDVKRRVDNVLEKLDLPEVYTQANEDEGKIFLLGRVKNAQDKERIKITLGDSLIKKTVDLIQVKEEGSIIDIDVLVFEIDKDSENELGLVWPTSATFTEPSGRWPTLANVPDAIFRVSNWIQGTAGTGGAITYVPLQVTINALAAEGKAEILSRPRLACQSGKEAELLVGGEVPIFTTNVASAGGEGTSVEYKEYGIKLNIKPTVSDDKRIKLGLKVEISEIGAAQVIGTTADPTAKAYPLTKRNVSTELFLDNGQTLAIGGLIKRKDETDTKKVPFFGDIPILGAAFRNKDSKTGGGSGQRGNSELFVTLTPKIVSEDKPAKVPEKHQEAKAEDSIGVSQAPNTEAINPLPAPAGPIGGYAMLVQKRIAENIAYPASAKGTGFHGTVILNLDLSYTGDILGSSIKNSSGYDVLDEHALSVAREIAPYPPFPPSIEDKELHIEIPVTYRTN